MEEDLPTLDLPAKITRGRLSRGKSQDDAAERTNSALEKFILLPPFVSYCRKGRLSLSFVGWGSTWGDSSGPVRTPRAASSTSSMCLA